MRNLVALLIFVAAAVLAAASYGAGLGDDGLFLHAMRARSDSMQGSTSTSAAPASCGAPPSTGLVVWLDGRNIDGSNNSTLVDGATFATWQDLGTIGDDPTQATGTAQPTYVASCIGGKACARFDGGDHLKSVTGSNFTFMSNGSDWTQYFLGRTTSANPDTFMVTTSTGNNANTNAGHRIVYDDRASQTRNDRISMVITNGSATVITAMSADNAFPAQTWHILTTAVDDDGGAGTDGFQYVNGTLSASAASTTTYAATDAQPLAIGRYSNSTGGNWVGDVAQVLIYNVAHDATARSTVESWIECVYGGTPQ